MIFSPQEKKVLFGAVRQAMYFFLTIGISLLFWKFADIFQRQTFKEFGIIENMQLEFLFASAFLFFLDGLILKKHAALLFFLASLCALASCRELDSFFDLKLPVISWKFGFLFPLSALIYIYKNRKDFRVSFFHFLETPAFNLMCTAVLIALALAQVFGHRVFIENVMGTEKYARPVRRILEEGSEAIAYFLILLSAIECYFDFSRKKED